MSTDEVGVDRTDGVNLAPLHPENVGSTTVFDAQPNIDGLSSPVNQAVGGVEGCPRRSRLRKG